MSYRARQKVYMLRYKLKTAGYAESYLNEDLTKTRDELLFKARNFFKLGKVDGVLTSDGTILIQDKSQTITRLESQYDCDNFTQKLK
ncbi:hypothetical protein DPMN_176225 [Dreissena polymorpha]|uniref:Uncharacterized protein n=1 Tax=Dreissena polymorpha TaxID=45954 RepID=A0A9D4IJF8_DREPO|nr:hypothetical protein DPMN_176225 [Dreissena polymorpha]